MSFNLKQILRALLFSTSEPLAVKDVQQVITRYHQEFDVDEESQGVLSVVLQQVPSLLTATQIRDAMEEIANELDAAGEVYRLVEGPNGYRMVIRAEFADWVRLLREEPKPRKLSPAALETLAIVAYRQPVTRSEIEAIRGVSADNGLSKLMEQDLIYVVGRADLPGRPIQYGTTAAFLEYCGIRSIEELPSSDILSPNQISEWIRRATLPEEEIRDQDVGLPDDEVFKLR